MPTPTQDSCSLDGFSGVFFFNLCASQVRGGEVGFRSLSIFVADVCSILVLGRGGGGYSGLVALSIFLGILLKEESRSSRIQVGTKMFADSCSKI